MTPQQVKGSVPLARELLLASANFRAAPDGDKKQVYEMIAAHAIALKRGWDDIAKDRLACGDYVNHAVERCKARDQLHDMAAAAIVRMIEPYALEDFMMTADGMVRKK